MNRIATYLGAGFAMALVCCKSGSTAAGSAEMPRSEVETELMRITGLAIPGAATNVSGRGMSIFTYAFDCRFDCAMDDLVDAWKDAPNLLDKVPVESLVPGEEFPAEVFDGNWPAGGGTQFVNVALTKIDGEGVRVEVRTTHE